jgi:hypothetical protein
VLEYIEVFYNRKRCHSSGECTAPVQRSNKRIKARQRGQSGTIRPLAWKTEDPRTIKVPVDSAQGLVLEAYPASLVSAADVVAAGPER